MVAPPLDQRGVFRAELDKVLRSHPFAERVPQSRPAPSSVCRLSSRAIWKNPESFAADLSQPGDTLELGGVTLADLLDAAGDVDSAAVAQAVAALIESRPGLAGHPRQRVVDMSQGHGNDRPASGKPSFNDLFAGRSHSGVHVVR